MPPFAGTAIRCMIQTRYSVPQDVRTNATVAFVLTCFDVVRSDPGRPRWRID